VRIEIVIYPGFDELDAIAPFEVFKSAAVLGADFETQLTSLHGAVEIPAGHGLRVQSEGKLGAGVPPSLLVIPGGGWNNRAARGVRTQVEQGRLPAEVRRLKEKGVTLASVCTGAMILASAGILRGRPATTHASAIDDLRAAGARIVEARVVDDGDVITSGGVTAGLDMALWLVERYAGEDIAQRVERRMEHKRSRDILRSSQHAAVENARQMKQ
jgi:transcriptional regulator GlxA family with amidase domain